MTAISDITSALEPIVAALGIDIDDIELSKAGNRRILEVFVDADGGVDLDKVTEASRAISEFLDASNVMGDAPYVLEVSSRGISRPLTKPVHWARNVGRLVTVSGDSVNASGRIVAFENPQVTLNVKGQMRKFDIGAISKAFIDVEFNRKDDE